MAVRPGERVIMKQFLKFAVVGFSNTLVHFAVYYTLLHFGLFYIISNIIAFTLSVCNSFFWNSKFVFKKKTTQVTFVKVFAANGCMALISTALLFLMVDIIGISELVAPVINICAIVPLSFFVNKHWAFKNKK